MKTSRPYKDKPWIILEESSWWEDILGLGYYRIRIEKSPEWREKVLKPTIEKFKKWNLKNELIGKHIKKLKLTNEL